MHRDQRKRSDSSSCKQAVSLHRDVGLCIRFRDPRLAVGEDWSPEQAGVGLLYCHHLSLVVVAFLFFYLVHNILDLRMLQKIFSFTGMCFCSFFFLLLCWLVVLIAGMLACNFACTCSLTVMSNVVGVFLMTVYYSFLSCMYGIW